MEGKRIVELAYDIQSGLGNIDVPDFEQMRTMGMAATLSIHLRGLGEIEYDVLRKVSDHYFNIPSFALKDIIFVLAEIEYIQVSKAGSRISSIIPNVPRFQDVYEGVGEYFTFSELNEHEQGTLLILSELQCKPENKDKLQNTTGIDNDLFSRCLSIGDSGNYIQKYRARGKDILVSPFYFADNLDSLVDITAKIGAADIQKVLDIVKRNQGWPLSLVETQMELGGFSLNEKQRKLLVHLCRENILKPPSLKFEKREETFIFTPAPGKNRLNPANREIYERAMALVSCVRKGQLLPKQYRIRMPVRLLESLREKGYLTSNSEASTQYRQLVFLRVGSLRPLCSERWEFHLIKTEENIKALDLAINLLSTGELSNLEVDHDARLALSKNEEYIQSVISAAELKKRGKMALDEDSVNQFEQLLLQY